MLFYSWKRIVKITGRSSKQIILAIKAMLAQRPPRNRFDPLYKYYYKDLRGDSFLINPSILLHNAFRYSNKEVAQYIGLASFRSYAHYLLTKDATLDLFHSPLDEATINKNRLLRIKDGKIHFLYEEATKEK